MSDVWQAEMEHVVIDEDMVRACVHLVDRAGASGFEIGHLHDDVPVEQAGWYAVAFYQGARITADDHKSPALAAYALAVRLLTGAQCRCGKPVSLGDGDGCRWKLSGARWEPGCDAAPITVQGGARGDYAAITQAMNRQQRRAQRKKSP